MFYAICDGPPWFFLKFETLEAMKTCDAIDEYSIVYSTPEQLFNSCTKPELEALVLNVLLASDCKEHEALAESIRKQIAIPASEKLFTKERATKILHEIVVKQASFWKPKRGTKPMPTHTDVSDLPEPILVTKTRQVRTRFNNDDKIILLRNEPNIREGTNRYRNMSVVMDCETVGEAMEKLRALDPSPGSGMDIRIAIKAGVIELEEV
tara:strand:- start:247 stop:873 length:627 start_codon:yes stop_codon:yes gene_type:complete